jgi:hypothetical protein
MLHTCPARRYHYQNHLGNGLMWNLAATGLYLKLQR